MRFAHSRQARGGRAMLYGADARGSLRRVVDSALRSRRLDWTACVEPLERRVLLSASFATAKDLASATMDSPFSVAVNDFNKDGKADYVASGNGSGNVCV